MRPFAYALAAILASTSVPAFAAQIAGLYNTGVDDDGNVLAAGVHDTHYVLNNGASKGGGPFVYENANYAATRGDAAFIAAFGDGDFRQNPATYALTFDLTGYDATTAFISGRFAADDVAEIFLNGVSTGFVTGDSFYTLTDFSIDTGFVAGLNTLTFLLTDTQGEPSALFVDRIESSVDAAGAVPEPASWAMMVGGFGMICGAMRRRQRISVSFA